MKIQKEISTKAIYNIHLYMIYMIVLSNSLKFYQAADIRINSLLTDRQMYPWLITSKTEGAAHFIVWQSEVTTNVFDIYAQKIDANGEKFLANEVLVNKLSTNSQFSVRGISLYNGNYVVCWGTYHASSKSQIFCNIFNINLTFLYTQEFQMSKSSTVNQITPFVCSFKNNNIFLIYRSNELGTYDLEGVVFDSNKNIIKSYFIINTTQAGTQGDGRGGLCQMFSDDRVLVMYTSQYIVDSSYEVMAKIYNPDLTVLKDEFIINTSTSGNQVFPFMGITSNDNFIITWESDHTGSDQIYYRAFDSLGNSIKEETLVNDSNLYGTKLHPHIAVDSEDNIYVIYYGNVSGVTVKEILLKQISLDPNTSSSYEMRITRDGIYTKDFPMIGFRNKSLLVACWQSDGQDGSNLGVYSNLINPYHLVNTIVDGDQNYPSVAALQSGGFVVTYESSKADTGGTSLGCLAQLYNISNNKVGNEILINTTTENNQMKCKVTETSNGNLLFIWVYTVNNSSYDIYGKIYTPSMTVVKPEFKINENVSSLLSSHVEVSIDYGNIFVLMITKPLGCSSCKYGVYGKIISSVGLTIKSEFKISSNTLIDEISPWACYYNSKILITWTLNNSTSGTGYDIFGIFFDKDGNALNSNEFIINKTTAGDQKDATCAALTNGNFVITYNSGGSDENIYAKIIDSSNTIIKDEFLVNTYTTNIQRYPKILRLVEGRFSIAWESYMQDGSGYGIFHQIFFANGDKVAGPIQVNNYSLNDQANSSLTQLYTGNKDIVISFSSEGDSELNGVYYEIISNCPQGKFYDPYDNYNCKACDSKCAVCENKTSECLSCLVPYSKIEDQKVCVANCTEVSGYASDNVNYICKKCIAPCLTCLDTVDNCKTCFAGLGIAEYSDNRFTCLNSFDGFFFDATLKYYRKCDISCISCSDNKYKCSACNTNANYFPKSDNASSCYLFSNSPPGYFYNSINKLHEPCDVSCITCSMSPLYCISCSTNYFPLENNLNDCRNNLNFPTGYYLDSIDKKYKKCDITSCETCINKSTECIKCKDNYFKKLNSSSIQTAGICLNGSGKYPNLFLNPNSNFFENCHESCLYCDSNSLNCTECDNANNFYKFNLKNNNYSPKATEVNNGLTDTEIKALNLVCTKQTKIYGFYLDNNLKEFLKCPDQCQDCTSSTCPVTILPTSNILILINDFL